MLEKITSVNAKDFQYRYQDTFGFLTSPSGRKLVVSIKEVNAEYVLASDGEETYKLNSDRGCELEFTQVPSGWFEPDPGVLVYINRMPERQWKRGISESNTRIRILNSDGSRLNQITIKPSHILQLFHPNPEIKSFKSLCLESSGYWSRYFVWGGNYVWAKDLKIGTVDHQTKKVTLDLPILEQEVKDAIRRSKHKEYFL